MTEFIIVTLVLGFAASLALNILFNFIALTTGKRTGSLVSFTAVTRLGFLFWLIAMVIEVLLKLGL